MINKKLLIIALVLVALVIGFVFLFANRPLTQNLGINNTGQPQDQTSNKPTDTIISVTRKDDTSYILSISSKSQKNLSALSIRLTYPAGTDFSAQSFVPNPDLVSGGWVFPVKSINSDASKNLVNVDISGIYPSTDGYNLTNEVTLGTLTNFPSLTFSVDQSETKIVEKSGTEVNYTFKQ